MNFSIIVSFATVLVICSFCGEDFKVLGRHSWRCKAKVKDPQTKDSSQPSIEILPNNEPVVSSEVTCCCGKKCKGHRGLKMHQRSCRTIHGLNGDSNTIDSQHSPDNENIDNENIDVGTLLEQSETAFIKKGVTLPKKNNQWSEANTFLKENLSLNEINEYSLEHCVNKMAEVTYNYFAKHYGTVRDHRSVDKELETKYKEFSKQMLKNALKKLKSKATPTSPKEITREIKFVSKLLRRKANGNDLDVNNKIDTTDHSAMIKRSFWDYAKKFIEKPREILPSFDRSKCFSHFVKTFRAFIPDKIFRIPNWIPKLSQPSIPFNLTAPSYREITNIIRRMKTSGSPCPLDQISIIVLKRSPYLRTYLTAIISQAWTTKTFPSTWKKAITVLIYKKGSTDEPANFRPITLQNVALKVMTSFIRNRVFEFLTQNGYAENNIQKGFTPKVAGTLEHTSHMAYLINHSKRKQRSIVITLIDLKNAFGEVHHNLIKCILEYHHVPFEIQSLVESLYKDFQTSILTKSYSTPFIPINRGVLQGDCLSPLLFNMIFNTFITSIRSQEFEQLGYKYAQHLSPRHWYQFADDAAIVTGQQYENQILLNAFTRWVSWANMIIRVDKCKTFGIQKQGTTAVQFLPKLLTNNSVIPPVKINEQFTYLGRHFNFQMDDEEHKR